MKTIIVLFVIAILLIGIRFAWGYFANRVERPEIQLIKTVGNVQIRKLPTKIYASVTVTGSESQAPTKAFGVLAGFIFGDNKSSSSISMTAPVITKPVSQPIAMTAPVISQAKNDGSYEVSFLMPKEYTLQTLPIPNDNRVRIHQVDSKTVAVISFSRYATQSNIDYYRKELLDTLKAASINTVGTSSVAQYNDPRTPPTMRTNEIWIEVDGVN